MLALVRPLNVVLFLVGVALGAWLAAGPEAFAPSVRGGVALAMLSGALIGGAANALNDLYDREIDAVNRPDRPLPSGRVSAGLVRVLGVGLTVAGVGLGALVSPLHGAIALVATSLLWAYNARLKRTPGAGNVAVALVIALALAYGGLAARPGALGGPLLAGAAFAFVTTLARELAKDVEDAAGDALYGARTLAVAWGPRRTAGLAAVVSALAVAGLPAALALGLNGSFFVVVLPAAAALGAAVWRLGLAVASPRSEAAAHAGRASGWLKAAMGAGIVALALARGGV